MGADLELRTQAWTNLASQFSLLARNAERHAENPQFRADMLVTLRNSAEKLNALIARLNRYGKNGREASVAFDVGTLARAVAAQFEGHHPVVVNVEGAVPLQGHAEALEQALVHLVQNGIDASLPDMPVFVGITREPGGVRIEIVDSGAGMSPEFIRSKLFKPFVSSKSGGFGIGACEARELVRGMGGRLDVESREGIGSRFIIRLPLEPAASTAEASAPLAAPQQKVA